MSERQYRCETCEWWDCDFREGWRDVNGDHPCKRFPPVLNRAVIDDDLDRSGSADVIEATNTCCAWYQPFTTPEDFCGEWKLRTPRIDLTSKLPDV